MVAFREPLLEPLGSLDGERDLHLAARELARELESERLEDAEHPAVVRQHEGDEPLDSVMSRAFGELLDEPRADASALERVRDGERALRSRGIAQARVVRKCHHALEPVLHDRAEQRSALRPVRVEHLLDDLRAEGREPVEAHVEALLGERAEEVEDRFGVGPGRRPEPESAPVAKDHVDDVGHEDILLLARPRRHTGSVPPRDGHRIRTGSHGRMGSSPRRDPADR